MTVSFPVRSPAVETLKKQLKISMKAAYAIKDACNHGKPKSALHIANLAMGGHGVESLYPEYPQFYYVNMGDTYDRTLYYNGISLQIGSWGDYVERHRGVAHDGSNPRNSKHWR
jgi:hypothetical protein